MCPGKQDIYWWHLSRKQLVTDSVCLHNFVTLFRMSAFWIRKSRRKAVKHSESYLENYRQGSYCDTHKRIPVGRFRTFNSKA